MNKQINQADLISKKISCCPKCGRITWIDHKPCLICQHSLVETDYEMTLRGWGDHQDNPLTPMAEDLRNRYCRNAPEFNQDAWDYRKKVDQGLIPQPHYPENIPKAPRCPRCNNSYIKEISSLERGISVATWGLASGKIGKSYKCMGCGHKW